MASVQSRTLSLRCLCNLSNRQITISPSTFPIRAAYCHCDSCRHMSGCVCVTSIPLSFENPLPVASELSYGLTGYEFSKDAIIHYFCPNCGTHMLAQVLPREQNQYKTRWFAMCGAIEDFQDYHPQHEYIADTKEGGITNLLRHANGVAIERWAGHPRISEQLPLGWRAVASMLPPACPMAEDMLLANCKCNGVRFWISPSGTRKRYPVEIVKEQLGHGMEWFVCAMASVPASNIFPDNVDELLSSDTLEFGTLKTYASSNGLRRSFCRSCGATAFIRKDGMEAVNVAIGLLNAVEGTRAETWLNWGRASLFFSDDGEVLERP